MTRIVEVHHIKTEQRFHKLGKQYGAVLAVVGGIVEILVEEERLLISELVAVGHIVEAELHIVEQGIDRLDLVHPLGNHCECLTYT